MPADRFFGISARLLAAASVLSVAGLWIVMSSLWRQTAQSYGDDGVATNIEMPFTDHLSLVMLDVSYRQLVTPLLFASALAGAAVVLLHRIRSWERVRRLRWEVLGAGLLVLVPAAVVASANLYVMTSARGSDSTERWFAPDQLVEQAFGTSATLAAALLVLVAAALAWLRLEPTADDTGSGRDDVLADELDDSQDDTWEDDTEDSGGREAVDRPRAGSSTRRDVPDGLAGAVAEDYRYDWSPEDFRPPS